MTQIQTIPLDRLTAAQDNPRTDLGDVGELAATIKAQGVLQPLLVTPRNGTHLIVAGARRFAAAKKAGLSEVPVIVREMDERARLEAMATENLQRADLSPLEEARVYQALVQSGLSQHELAARIGKSQGHVSKRLALLELPDVAQRAVDAGKINLEAAVELGKAKDLLTAHPKKAADVVRQLEHGHGPRHAIEQVKREVKNEEVRAAKAKELREKGGKVVDHVPQHWYSYGKKENPPKVARISDLHGFNLPKDHSAEPCHAVAIEVSWDYKAQLIPVCTDSTLHKRKKASARSSGPSAESQKKRAAAERERERAIKARAEFLRKAVAGTIKPGDVLEMIALAWMNEVGGEAFRLFGIKPGTSWPKQQQQVAAIAKKAPLRVLLASAISSLDNALEYDEPDRNPNSGVHLYVAWLQSKGYKLSEREAAWLPAKKAGRPGARKAVKAKKSAPKKGDGRCR